MPSEVTFVAQLTGPGSSALATLGVSGPQAWAQVAPMFRPRGKTTPDPSIADQHWLGTLIAGEIGDEVVLTLSGNPARQRVEIHCHGGPTLVRSLLDSFIEAGAIEIGWKQWLHLHAPNRLQGLLAECLTQCTTERAAGILAQQQANWEPALRRFEQISLGDVEQFLQDALPWSELGKHLTDPWRVVVAGAPNAGKSSLINAVLGYERSIVTNLPGTTRDLLTARMAIEGWPLEWTDTAGIRTPADEIEAQGVARAESALQSADLVLWLVDVTAPVFPPSDLPAKRLLLVGNKTDLREQLPTGISLGISAKTSQGIAELLHYMVRMLIPTPPAPGTAVPFHKRMVDSMQCMLDAARRQDRAALVNESEWWLSPGTEELEQRLSSAHQAK